MSKRAASGPPPRASAEEDDDGLPPVGRDRMLNLWRPQNPSPVQIIASLVMPQTADTALMESTHPFDIDQARLEARVARLVAYNLRHPLPLPANAPVDPSESMAGLDYHPLLDTRPSFVDLYEAAIAIGDHAALTEMDAILSTEADESSLYYIWCAHVVRFVYAAGVAGDLVTARKLGVVYTRARLDIAELAGLLTGGHFELFLQALGIQEGAFIPVCEWLVGHNKTHLLTQGDRLARIFPRDEKSTFRDVLGSMLLMSDGGWRELLVAFAALATTRQPLCPRYVRFRRTNDSLIIRVLMALIDPTNPRSTDYYVDILRVFGFNVDRDLPNAYMSPTLRAVPLTPVLVAILAPRLIPDSEEFHMRALLEYGRPLPWSADVEPDWSGDSFHVRVDVGRAVTILTTLSVRPVFHGLAPGDWPRLLACIPSEEHQAFLEDQISGLENTDPSAIALLDIFARECGSASLTVLLQNGMLRTMDTSIDYMKALSVHIGVANVMLRYVRDLLSIGVLNTCDTRCGSRMGNFLPILRALHALCPPGTVHRDSALHRALVNLCKYVKTPEMDRFVDTLFPK